MKPISDIMVLYKSKYLQLESSLNFSTLLNDVNNLPADTLALRNAIEGVIDSFFVATESYSYEMSFYQRFQRFSPLRT